ncbi:non-ribosomal peptide synthetase [Ectothiorhodospira shaposhnikovii]|uniref:non-ribosomal peptide synthetase n=1 Tax=Ectothiorhodospira shaposhnikovii TaxID=1054 RepID=UPI00190822D5|nr:non-ribosomal peptide synthetase [Ectothiorhodospira shaposhnikovii]
MFNRSSTEMDSLVTQSGFIRDFACPAPYVHQPDFMPVALKAPARLRLAEQGTPAPEAGMPYVMACLALILARHVTTETLVIGVFDRISGRAWPARIIARREGRFDVLVRCLERDWRLPGRLRKRAQRQGGGRVPVGVQISRGGRGRSSDGGAEVMLHCIWRGCIPQLTLEYNCRLYTAGAMVSVVRQLEHLLQRVPPSCPSRIGRIRLMPPGETRRVLVDFNRHEAMFPLDQTLDQLVEAQARRTPVAVACVHDDQCFRYSALDREADIVMDVLRRHGIGRGDFVAVFQPRGIGFLVCMLGIWKTGAAYVPIEFSYPAERISYMLEDSMPSAVLVEATTLSVHDVVLNQIASSTLVLCREAGRIFPIFNSGPTPAMTKSSVFLSQGKAHPTDPAYMIYTSGSTGHPKGAIVRHDSAVNHILGEVQRLGAGALVCFLQTAPASSDISVWQMVAPLLFGGRTVIVDDVMDVERLAGQIITQGATLVELVPVVIRHLLLYLDSAAPVPLALPSLRYLIFTGEAAPVELVNVWLQRYPEIPVINAYGPTEAADDVTQALIRQPLPTMQLRTSIGQPLPNVILYICDAQGCPLPVGTPGEIFVGGIAVGNGYWRQPGQTQERFSPDPFGVQGSTRVYRTGDMGRWLDDGSVDYLGRMDEQLQIRGMRVELGELERVLEQCPGVAQGAVVGLSGESGDLRLRACVVPIIGALLDTAEVKQWMARHFPMALVPSDILLLAALPMTPAGKIDRRRLVQMDGASWQISHATTEPVIEGGDPETLEWRLLRIWRQELGCSALGLDDDFFGAGGDSLAALTISAAARAKGIRVRPQDIFRHPTVAGLAARVRGLMSAPQGAPGASPGGLKPIEPLSLAARCAILDCEGSYEDVHPPTSTQQGIYLQAVLSRDKTVYVDQYCYALEGRLNISHFQACWDRVMRRHAVLRSGFLRRFERRLLQVVWRDVRLPLEIVDAARLTASARNDLIAALKSDALAAGFVLDQPPLMRLALVRLDPECHYLVWTHHHLILDGWSMNQVLGEVLADYDAMSRGEVPDSTPPRVTFRDYIDWMQQQDLSAVEDFWKRTLTPLLDRGRAEASKPASGDPRYVHLDRELGPLESALGRFAQETGCTPAILYQAAWALALCCRSGGHVARFGMVMSGRHALPAGDLTDVVGMCVTTLPVQVTLPDRPGGVMAWLREMQTRMLSLQDCEYTPLTRIREWLEIPPSVSLFDSLLVMSNYRPLSAGQNSVLLVRGDAFRTIPTYGLTLIVNAVPRPGLRLIFDENQYDAEVAGVIMDCLYGALRSLVSEIQSPWRLGHARPMWPAGGDAWTKDSL